MRSDLTFEQIVREHQELVFRTLLRLTGSREHLDDLAQEVFLRLFRALPAFRGDALLSTYLYRITVNVAQDEWKRRRRVDCTHTSLSDEDFDWDDRLAHPGQSAEQEIADRELQQALELHLQSLSSVERTVLVLFHQEEQSYGQIAVALNLPIGTVRTHLHRGRAKLRDRLAAQTSKESTPRCATTR